MAKGKKSAAEKDLLAPPGYQAGGKREGFGCATIQIIVVLAAVGAGLFFYWQKAQTDKAVDAVKKEAVLLKQGDDVKSLIEARSKYLAVRDYGRTVEENENILTNMADIDARLYQAYGIVEFKEWMNKNDVPFLLPESESKRTAMIADKGLEERDTNLRDEAKGFIDEAKSLESRKPARYAAEAYLLIGDGDPAGAEKVITELTEKGIREARILHALSVALLAQGRAKEAQNAVEEAQKLTTNLVRIPIQHGDALAAQGKFGAARTSYGKALQLNPEHIQAQASILLAQAISGDSKPALLHKQANKLLERIEEMRPIPPRIKAFVKYADGEVSLRDGKAKDALKATDVALESYPRLHEAHSLRGRALAKLKKRKKAKEAFDKALAAVPTSLPYAEAGAEVLTRLGRAKWGVELLQKVTTAAPDNGLAWVRLALTQVEAKDVKGAKESAKKALGVLGNAHEFVIYADARILHADGKLKEATEKYENAIKEASNKEWPEVYYQMGLLRMEEKDYEDAVALLKQAAKFWEKGGGSLDEIADAYEAIGKSFASGNKRAKKQSKEWFDLSRKIRAGKAG